MILKRIALLCAMLALPVLGFAQGSIYQGKVPVGAGGSTGGFELITVCSSGANLKNQPCNPTASIFSDFGLTVPLANPFRADAYGNYQFYGTTGAEYIISITSPAFSPGFSFKVTLGGSGGGGGGGAATTALTYGGLLSIDKYGARPTDITNGYTYQLATCTSGSKSVTLHNTGILYANSGDGIALFNCGAATTLTTPAAPSLAPLVALGPTGTGLVLTETGQSTTYSAKLILCDNLDGCTAASSAATTTAGDATLGTHTDTVTSIAMSGGSATLTLGSPTTSLIAQTRIHLYNTSVGSIDGWYSIKSVLNSTHITIDIGNSTAFGGATTATGGTIAWKVGLGVFFPPQAGLWEGCAYLTAGPGITTPVFMGCSRPSTPTETTDGLNITYWGATDSGNLSVPVWMPLTPPTTATNEVLATTVTAGMGTTDLTIATNALNSTGVFGAAAAVDNSLAFQAACVAAFNAGDVVYIPPTLGFGAYVIDAPVTCPGGTVRSAGSLFFENTITFNGTVNWYGMLESSSGGAPNFGLPNSCRIPEYVGAGYPALLLTTNANASSFDGICMDAIGNNTFVYTFPTNVSNSGNPNGALLFVDDDAQGVTWNNSVFQTGSGSQDITGIGLLIRDIAGGAFDLKLTNITGLGGPGNSLAFNDTSWAPIIASIGYGNTIDINRINTSGRGMFFQGSGFNIGLSISNYHNQGPIQPLVSVNSNAGLLTITNCQDDSNSMAILENLNYSFVQFQNPVYLTNCFNQTANTQSAVGATVTGEPITSLTIAGPIYAVGQNFGLNLPNDTGNSSQLFPSLFSALATCNGTTNGTSQYVSDSTPGTVGLTITGGGSNKVTAFCNGANWVVGQGGATTGLTQLNLPEGTAPGGASATDIFYGLTASHWPAFNPNNAGEKRFAGVTGSITSGHCAAWNDTVGTLIDSGSGCGGGGGSGSVTSVGQSFTGGLISVSGSPITTTGTLALTVAGTSGGVPCFNSASTWTSSAALTANSPVFGGGAGVCPSVGTRSGNTTEVATVTGAVTSGHNAVWDASGNVIDSGAVPGTVTSAGTSFTGGLISVAGSPVTTTGTAALTVAGTSGGVPYFSSASTWASSAALTANLPVIGGGAGSAPAVGTRSGNTTAFVTTTGAHTNGNCASWDASGNVVDFGGACGGGGGGGTVTSVGLGAPTGFTVSGSPVVASGTLSFTMPTGWATGALLLGNGAASVSSLGIGANGTVLGSNGTTASWTTIGAGTVTNFSASNITTASQIFATQGVTAPGTTPALTFTLSNAPARTVFANCTAGSFAPDYVALTEACLPAPTVFTDKANTFGAFLNDFSASTIKLPVAAGGVTTANGNTIYDTTNKNWHDWQNGADKLRGIWSAVPTTGHCVQATVAANVVNLTDAGVACSTGNPPTLQTNGVNNTTQTALNFVNTTGAPGITFTNPGTSTESAVVANTTGGGNALVAATVTSARQGDYIGFSATPAAINITPGVVPNGQTTSYAILTGDRGKRLTMTSATATANTIAQANSAGYDSNFYFKWCTAVGSGPAKITPATSTVNSFAYIIVPGGMCTSWDSDNTNYTADYSGVPSVFALTDAATVAWDLGNAPAYSTALTFTTHGGNRTLNITNPLNGGIYDIKFVQDATGGEGVTLGTCGAGVFKISGGGAGAITLSTGAGAIDLFVFKYDGTNCLGTPPNTNYN